MVTITDKEFEYFNPNPLENEDNSDCVVRAFCGALNKPWDEVYNDLVKLGFEMKTMPHSTKAIDEYLKRGNFKLFSTYNKNEMNVVDFVKENPGTFILDLGWHVLSAKDGKFYDLNMRSGMCNLIQAWRLDETSF